MCSLLKPNSWNGTRAGRRQSEREANVEERGDRGGGYEKGERRTPLEPHAKDRDKAQGKQDVIQIVSAGNIWRVKERPDRGVRRIDAQRKTFETKRQGRYSSE